MEWETLLHVVIQGTRLMEVLPFSTCGIYGYLHVPSVPSRQGRGRMRRATRRVFGARAYSYLTTFGQLGWGWARKLDACWLLPSNNYISKVSLSWPRLPYTPNATCLVFTCGPPLTCGLLGSKGCISFSFVSQVPSIL